MNNRMLEAFSAIKFSYSSPFLLEGTLYNVAEEVVRYSPCSVHMYM